MTKLEMVQTEFELAEARLCRYFASDYQEGVVFEFLMAKLDQAHGALQRAKRDVAVEAPA